MIEDLKNLMAKNNISESDTRKIISGFKRISGPRGKLIYAALSGHPELIPAFIDLMNKKIDLIKNPSEEKENLIIKKEEELLDGAFESMEE